MATSNKELEERVRTRLCGAADGLLPYKGKVYELRRLVAGDFSKVLQAPAAQQDGGPKDDQIRIDSFYDFIVTDFLGGNSNRLLQTIKQLMMQIAFTEPDVEFEDLEPLEATVNAQWIKQRLAPAPVGCGARDSMKLGLLDFMIGGFGWSYCCMHEGTPSLDHCDTLDMKWDRHARTPSDMAWASCRFVGTLAEWISQFGAGPFADEFDGDARNLDKRLALEFYYDIDTADGGSFYVFKGNVEEAAYGDPVFSGPNPYRFDLGGKKVTYLPFTPIYFMALPSCKEPIGIVELMFPDQLALWGIENYRRTARERGAPFFQVEEGAMAANEEAKFLKGEFGSAVKVKTGKSITANGGLGVPPELAEEMAYYERQFIAQSGLNPYSLGSPPAGIEYASEVKEISGMSGLVVSYASEDHAAWWRDTMRKYLGAGALYDDQPITIRVGQVPVQFGPGKPISQFLRPDADVVVAADKMAFRPRAQRIAEAQRDLQVAMSVAPLFPQAPAKAYEKYLRAAGEKDVAGWMQPPPPMPAMAVPGGPGADNSAAAASGGSAAGIAPAISAQASTV